MPMNEGKYRCEGSKIVKRTTGEAIPSDEPVFILRARDRLALQVLRFYLQVARDSACVDQHIAGCERAVRAFELFQQGNPKRMKQPGITLDSPA